ncbi:tyrosine-type recombinase/integrase [Amphritea sp.]|uniref:tyrosine-type recombinase/integrase n=1 Tax=Amphritea sp. TaxID=1872502 RepID=UPI003A936880
MAPSSPNRMRLTNRLIEKFLPHDADSRSTEREISDTDVVGLKLLIGKNGSKKFLLRYTYRSHKRSIAIGPFGPLSITEAREMANQYKGMVAKGTDPKQEKLKKQRALTLDEFFYQQYAPLVAAKKRSERSDLGRYKHHVHNALGGLLLDEVTTQNLLALQNSLTVKLAPASNNRVLALCRHIFNTAEQWGLIDRSPAKSRSVRLLREDNQRTRLLTDNQLRALFKSCDEDDNYFAGQYFKFLLLTGARRSEAAQAKWEHINLNLARPTWRVPTSKTGGYTAYLNRLAVELLRHLRRIQGHPFIFPGGYPNHKGYDGPITSPSKAFKRILCRAGITGEYCIHQLRHQHASIIANNGGNVADIMLALQHSSPAMASRYTHLSPNRIAQTGHKIADTVEQALAYQSCPK